VQGIRSEAADRIRTDDLLHGKTIPPAAVRAFQSQMADSRRREIRLTQAQSGAIWAARGPRCPNRFERSRIASDTRWMDLASSETPTEASGPPATRALALLLGGLLLYVLVRKLLDPPPTWSRCTPPSSAELAELSVRRQDFLLIAIPLLTAYGILLASRAWTWAAERQARQGHKRRPGRLARMAALVLGLLWLLLIGDAFIADEVGGAIFWGFVLAAAGVAVSVALAIGIIIATAVGGESRSRWKAVVDSLAVGLAWSILLFGMPLFFVGVAVVGKDTTLWC
jgi:hypothetical protein